VLNPKGEVQSFILEDLTVNIKSVTHLVFMFQLILFFRILRSWKARISHRSIWTKWYVVNSFRWLEAINRVRNWNKVKNYKYVGSKLQLCQLEVPKFIYKLMCQSSLIKSVSLFSVNFIVLRAEMKAKLLF